MDNLENLIIKKYECTKNYFNMLPLILKYIFQENENKIYPFSKINYFKSFFYEPIRIIDNIYIGSIFNISNRNSINKYNITNIINTTDKYPNYFPDEYLYYNININNNNIINSDYIDSIIDFINNSFGNVIIYCLSGNDNSVIVLICYLMQKKKLSVDEAINLILRKKLYINPSKQYINILKQYENNYSSLNNTYQIV